MNLEDVLTLVRAGFTAEQVAAMVRAPAPAPAPTPALTLENVGKLLDDKLTRYTANMQAANIQASTQPPEETVDSILASIIRPPRG